MCGATGIPHVLMGCAGTASSFVSLQECFDIAEEIGSYPLIIRPAFTLGGSGGGIAYNREEFENICKSGLSASATSQVRCTPDTAVMVLWFMERRRDTK